MSVSRTTKASVKTSVKASVKTSVKASVQGLEKVKAASAKKGWHKTSPAFLDAACVSAATLKRFWRGIPIAEDSFRAICKAVHLDCDEVLDWPLRSPARSAFDRSRSQAFNQSTDPQSTDATDPRSTGSQATDADPWVGRADLTQSLHTQLTSTTRLVSITGLTGVGKTAIARYLASLLSAEGYTCIHIRCDQLRPPTLASIAHRIFQQGRSHKGSATPVALSLPRLVAHLQQRPYVFIFDALEGLLTPNVETGWSEFHSRIWPQFFQAILGAENCSSRFILTAQDIPNELDTLGENWPQRWCAHALEGLNADDQISLFRSFGLSPEPHSRAYEYLRRMGCACAGHPLALSAIAQDIATACGGNIAAYEREHLQSIQRQSIQPSGHSTRTYSSHSLHSPHSPYLNLHSHSLRNRVQPKLAHLLNRLKAQHPYAYDLLCAGATLDNRPKLIHSWLQSARDLPAPASQTRWLLDVLCDRAFLTPLVINNRLHFTLHPLIHSFLLAPA
jgi:hypothetical protein